MKKGNLYYYFRNKEEILFACHQYSLDRLHRAARRDRAERRARRREAAAPDRRLRPHDPRRAARHGAVPRSRGADAGASRRRSSRGAIGSIAGCADHRGRRRAGAFGPCDPKLLSFAILGAVNWIPRWFKPDGPVELQEIADRFADYLIAGLRRITVRLRHHPRHRTHRLRHATIDRSPWPRHPADRRPSRACRSPNG